jgi:hypothetical protein
MAGGRPRLPVRVRVRRRDSADVSPDGAAGIFRKAKRLSKTKVDSLFIIRYT